MDRQAFKEHAKKQPGVTFRLWDAETGGNQCGADWVLPMDQLVVLKLMTDRFDDQKPRQFARIEAVLGSDEDPVTFCDGDTWIEVTVGDVTLTCDFSAKPASARRLLRALR